MNHRTIYIYIIVSLILHWFQDISIPYIPFFLVFPFPFLMCQSTISTHPKKTRRIAWRCFEIASLRTCRRGFLMVVWWLMASDFENEWDKIYSNRYEWTYERYEWWQWLMVMWIMIFSEHEMLTIRWWFWGYFKMIDDNYMMNFGLRSENLWVYIIHGW